MEDKRSPISVYILCIHTYICIYIYTYTWSAPPWPHRLLQPFHSVDIRQYPFHWVIWNNIPFMQTSETISRSFTRSCHGVGHDKNFSKYWMFWLLLFFWFSRCSFGASCFLHGDLPKESQNMFFTCFGFLEAFLMFFCFLHGALPKESKYCCSCFFSKVFCWALLKESQNIVFFLKVIFQI